ncbi:PRTRC system ThiF family protein [Spirosoma sp.]|uniref:PRTRC system ThiF family protein n=1 Tax=Spirosoma sp. TaxID=1899569 RepID=UPI002636A49D|nr:PRTRC system ThiF family protein [Spirosoma sp.]MCX6217653.1 PRTRC system ThiF family protein [Spirosoma sp.]
MSRKHYTAPYLLQPTNPITVNLIGAGGTGSKVITALAQLDTALFNLGHPGLQVNVYDDDVVTQANLGRQLFAESELHLSKSVALVNRINRFYGTCWKAFTCRYSIEGLKARRRTGLANLTITCVDSVAARIEIAAILNKPQNKQDGPEHKYYWMDFGNSRYTGQCILSTVGEHPQPKSEKFTPVGLLPFVTDEYAEVLAQSETGDDTPSCSLAEALTKQDLYMNGTLATMGMSLLWNLFRNGMTDSRGFFLNLADFRSQPLKV